MTAKYTTWGSVRGGCREVHDTYDEAAQCLFDDCARCAAVGGYSDRELRKISTAAEATSYDVRRGPGE